MIRTLIPVLATAFALSACSDRVEDSAAPAATVAPAAAATPAINEFLDGVFEREIELHPQWQSMLGRKTDRLGEWNDVSDAAAEAAVARVRADLERIRKDYGDADLSPAERLSYDLFVYDAERAIGDHAFFRHHYVVDQFNGQLTGLITVLKNLHPIQSVADAEDYISRIKGLEAVLNEMSGQLAARAGMGIVPPAFAFPAVLTDATAIASGVPIDESGERNAVFADFMAKVDRLDTDEATREDLERRARDALSGPFARGFQGLIAQLQALQPIAAARGNLGVWSLPDGEAYYRNRILHHTTLPLTADEVHDIGLRETARIQDEMRGIMRQVGFDGSLQEFFTFIREDPNNYYEDSDAGREQFLSEARALIEGIYAVVGDYFNQLPEAALEVRRVEPWRENSTSIAFYNRPSEDGSRPGIYYANLADMNSVQRYVFSAITYHESVPGHHFQIALAQELEGLPMFRKYAGYGAYTEGWALYAEKLAKEMGFYADPYHDFGRLQDEIWRAVRLVVDTGMHARRWTREQCIQYFLDNTPLSEGDIVTEVERFFVNPGQALGYKIGMNRILELRARARQALGEDFDIRAFHDAVIGAGSLPLGLLERRLDAYIAGASG